VAFSYPSGVTIDFDHNLLIADSNNGVIRKIYGIGSNSKKLLQILENNRILINNNLSNFSCCIRGQSFFLHNQILICRAPQIFSLL